MRHSIELSDRVTLHLQHTAPETRDEPSWQQQTTSEANVSKKKK